MDASGASHADEDRRRSRRNGALFVVAAATLWSTGGMGIKVAVAEPLVIAGLRSAFALAFMAVALLVALRRSGGGAAFVSLLRRPLVWAAAVCYAVTVVCFVLAARRTTAANAIFLQYTAPVYVAVIGGPLLGERVTARDLIVVVACVLGMGLAFGGELGEGRALGNVLAIVSSLGFAGLPLMLRLDQRELERDGRPEVLQAAVHAPLVAICLGNAVAFLVALPAVLGHPVTGEAATRTWMVIAGLGVFQIGVPYVLYASAVRRLRALEGSLIATIEPVLSPIWVVLATGETPSRLAMAGGAVIVVAVAVQGVSGRG